MSRPSFRKNNTSHSFASSLGKDSNHTSGEMRRAWGWPASMLPEEEAMLKLFYRFISKGASGDEREIASGFMEWIVKKLKRARAYYRLERLDRAFIGLAIRCKPKLKSAEFLRVLSKILVKAERFIKSFYEMAADEGKKEAELFSRAAYSWGNKEALEWKEDVKYRFHLGLVGRSLARCVLWR